MNSLAAPDKITDTKHPRKIALELQELKKSGPPVLYKKYLSDLETGKPGP